MNNTEKELHKIISDSGIELMASSLSASQKLISEDFKRIRLLKEKSIISNKLDHDLLRALVKSVLLTMSAIYLAVHPEQKEELQKNITALKNAAIACGVVSVRDE